MTRDLPVSPAGYEAEGVVSPDCICTTKGGPEGCGLCNETGRRVSPTPGQPVKGAANGLCNRTACQAPLADEHTHQFMEGNFTGGPRLHYCERCAADFDDWDHRSGDAVRITREDKLPDFPVSPAGYEAEGVVSPKLPEPGKPLRAEDVGYVRDYWSALVDADWDLIPNEIRDDLEARLIAAGLAYWRSVEPDDLETSFAADRGLEKGGSCLDLTALGHLAYKADPEGWMPWSGGENPVPGQMVEVRQQWAREMTTGGTAPGKSEDRNWAWVWGPHDIIAFRLVSASAVHPCYDEHQPGCDCVFPEQVYQPRPSYLDRLVSAEPDRAEGGESWQALSCDDQLALATRIAANVGYELTPEPEHPDSPHASPSQEQAGAVAWQVRTSDGFGGFLTDTYPHNGKQLIRQGYTVTPLGPLAASPPSRALSPDEREAVERRVRQVVDFSIADARLHENLEELSIESVRTIMNIFQPEVQ